MLKKLFITFWLKILGTTPVLKICFSKENKRVLSELCPLGTIGLMRIFEIRAKKLGLNGV